MENFQDIFNLSAEDFVEKKTSKESEFFKPNAKDGKDNVYSALIRFVPFWKDPRKSKLKKYSYWLEDTLTGDGFSVDCPSTIGQKSIIQDTYWKLAKSSSVAEQKISEKFKRRENYYAIVQILKDDQHPDNVGKMKLFKFGTKLNAIIQSELQPEYGTPYNCFDPLKGRPMALKVTLSGGYNNYDLSKFVGDSLPCLMNGEKINGDPETMKAFFEYLKTESPNLANYDYKEWDDDMRAKVKSVIENTVPSMRTSENLAKESSNASRNASPSFEINLDEKIAPADLKFDDFDKIPSEFESSIYDGL